MLHEKIDVMIAQARKEQRDDELFVYKLIKNEFLKYEKSEKFSGWNDVKETNILLNMCAQREDSIKQYNAAGRSALADNEAKELNILKELMPKQPTAEEIEEFARLSISEYMASKGDEFTLSMRDMKPILEMVKGKYPNVNGGIISQVLKTYL